MKYRIKYISNYLGAFLIIFYSLKNMEYYEKIGSKLNLRIKLFKYIKTLEGMNIICSLLSDIHNEKYNYFHEMRIGIYLNKIKLISVKPN